MKVDLIKYDKDARELLIFAKNTRLNMNAANFKNLSLLLEEEKEEELKKVFGSIGSQLEFTDYIFLISDDSRAFTQQLTRHRHASFAQQTQRAVDHTDFDYVTPESCKESAVYRHTMELIKRAYQHLIVGENIPLGDARGVLPMNATSNILMKVNLRSLSEIMNIRLCFKAQGEFQEVAREMKKVVLSVHPWADKVLRMNCAQYGYCCFPNEKECPIKLAGLIKDWTEEEARAIEEFAKNNIMEKKYYA